LPDSVQPIRVFLASPGGVESERRATREAAEELNKSLRRHGWQIEIDGWEERGPAGGRAQADINKDVERCDVLLALVWDRWGTPTGDSSSGFAEEWDLALKRRERTGNPDVWLYLRRLPSDADSEDEQTKQVRQFREKVTHDETAFYKQYDTTEEYRSLIRVRLLTLALERSGLTRVDIGGAAIDWAAAYDQNPAWLVAHGTERQSLADTLIESDPGEAANLLCGLARDVEAIGFVAHARELKIRACEAFAAGGRTAEAVETFREILGRMTWWMAFDEIPRVVDRLSKALPPDVSSEAAGWRACGRAPDDPAWTANRLASAIEHAGADVRGSAVEQHWLTVLWRCQLYVEEAGSVSAAETVVPSANSTALELELAMLHADGLRAAGDPRADEAWQHLRLVAHERLEDDPASAAWIQTRAALDLVNAERLSDAERAYADVASRWSQLATGQDEAALAFFSAQAASRLEDPWRFAGWGLRELAASQRRSRRSFFGRGEELERVASQERLDGHPERAIPLLLAARWCCERSGMLHGVLKDRSLLAAAYEASRAHTEAVVLHCLCKERKAAETAASNAKEAADVVRRLAGRWPAWSLESRLGALGRVGRSADGESAGELIALAVATIGQPERRLDNTKTAATEALAALALATDDAETRDSAARCLRDLAIGGAYPVASAARSGLRMLVDVGMDEYSDQLVSLFIANPQIAEPGPAWVAERLGDAEQAASVRAAALNGNPQALTALVRAGLIQQDDQLRAGCERVAERILASDLGMMPDGEGIAGLLALDRDAAVVAATGNEDLCREMAERLLVYASETKWPMHNRVGAVAGLWELRESLDRQGWVEQLKPLASPENDLDDESAEWSREMWAERGDLEAMAIRAAAAFSENTPPPDWLVDAAREATYDERAPVVQAGWFAAQIHPALFEPHGARRALRHPSNDVRATALDAWRASGREIPPTDLRRLARDSSIQVKFAVLPVLKDHPDEDCTKALLSDPDGYVRGIAAKELEGATPT
jgi:hypothetical protein